MTASEASIRSANSNIVHFGDTDVFPFAHAGTRYWTKRAKDLIAASRALRVRTELLRVNSRSSRKSRTRVVSNWIVLTNAIAYEHVPAEYSYASVGSRLHGAAITL